MFDEGEKRGFNAYITFLAIKQHFTVDSYDFFRYNGKVNAKYDSFITKNDKYMFIKLASFPDVKGLVLSNMVDNPKVWVGDLLDKNIGHKKYTEWKKTQDRLSSIFKEDLNKLDVDNLKDAFKTDGQKIPLILSKYLSKDVSLETLSILQEITNVKKYWDANLKEKFLTPKVIKKSQKYFNFLDVDKEKYEQIISDFYK